MDVGISSGTGNFINSASGEEIPALDGTNIIYVPSRRRGYVEFKNPTQNQLREIGLIQ